MNADLIMSRNKRISLFTAVLSALVLLTGGWGQKPVELSLTNLIDLDKAIELSVMGVKDSGENKDAVSDNDAEDEAGAGKVEKNSAADEKSAKRVTVRITGREIKCDGNTYSSPDGVIRYINTKYQGKLSVRLTDDYAVAEVYHSVDGELGAWCREKGYAYDAD